MSRANRTYAISLSLSLLFCSSKHLRHRDKARKSAPNCYIGFRISQVRIFCISPHPLGRSVVCVSAKG